MLKRTAQAEEISFQFDDETLIAQAGDSVAAAVMANDQVALRVATVSKKPRGPFCMMGACYECLVEIDGKTVQACMTAVTEGLKVRRVNHEDV